MTGQPALSPRRGLSALLPQRDAYGMTDARFCREPPGHTMTRRIPLCKRNGIVFLRHVLYLRERRLRQQRQLVQDALPRHKAPAIIDFGVMGIGSIRIEQQDKR